MSVALQQLFEYFMWKSLETHDTKMNRNASIAGWINLFMFQPISALCIIPSQFTMLRNILLTAYSVSLAVYVATKKSFDFRTIRNTNRHLEWMWNKLHGYENIVSGLYLLCMFSLVLSFPVKTLVLFSILISAYSYSPSTTGSLWCFGANSLMLYYLYLIIIKSYANIQHI